MSRRSCTRVGLGLVLGPLLSAAPAAAQDYPPCPPGFGAGATLHASDLEDAGGSLTATHTISLTLETSDGEFPDFTVALPPGARRRFAGGPAFQFDAAGPVTITATWSDFHPSTGDWCTASTTGTFDLHPPEPLRFVPPRRASRLMTELQWRIHVGENADLRPIEARLRGVRRARFPRASAPVQTMALVLRRGDGRALPDVGRVLRSAGWRFRFAPTYPEAGFTVRMSDVKKSRRRGFGFELDFVQGGERIGRTRAKGRCEFTVVGPLCRYRARHR